MSKLTHRQPWRPALLAVVASFCAAHMAAAQDRPPVDRTILPIRPPAQPAITELDVRNATMPETFEVTAPDARIEHLETELHAARTEPPGGGFLAGLFGGGTAPRRPAQPSRAMPQGAPGGFLAGAAQTAMGVAGGMLLANALAGTFAGEAAAAEAPPEEEPDVGDVGFEDDGDW